MKRKITKRAVDDAKPKAGRYTVWDTELRGFGLRVNVDGSKTYVVKYSFGGRQWWYSIGKHGSWTPEKARREAKSLLGEVADGDNPAGLRRASRDNPTVADLSAMFLREHVRPKRKPSTAEVYRDILERLVVPVLGRFRVADVTRADVAKLHHKLRETPRQANHVVAVLSRAFNWAEQRGYRPDGTNPCMHIDKYPERKRERFLSEGELASLGDALAEAERDGDENPCAVAALRLLVFTGCRRGEILGLRWEDVNFQQAMLQLPDSKTGAKVVYLSPPALDVLSKTPRLESNPYVIRGNKPGAHLVNLKAPWGRIRKKAGLDDVRIHDIRHSYASMAASGGASLPMIGKLLGHSQAQTTQRYAHFAADPVRAANEAIGQRIAAAMQGKAEGGEVIELSNRKA